MAALTEQRASSAVAFDCFLPASESTTKKKKKKKKHAKHERTEHAETNS